MILRALTEGNLGVGGKVGAEGIVIEDAEESVWQFLCQRLWRYSNTICLCVFQNEKREDPVGNI